MPLSACSDATTRRLRSCAHSIYRLSLTVCWPCARPPSEIERWRQLARSWLELGRSSEAVNSQRAKQPLEADVSAPNLGALDQQWPSSTNYTKVAKDQSPLLCEELCLCIPSDLRPFYDCEAIDQLFVTSSFESKATVVVRDK